MSKFDRCAIRLYQDFLHAEQQDNLLPSMAEGMAVPTNMRQGIMDGAEQLLQRRQEPTSSRRRSSWNAPCADPFRRGVE